MASKFHLQIDKIDADNGLHIVRLKQSEPPIRFVKPANEIQMTESTKLAQNMKLTDRNPVLGLYLDDFYFSLAYLIKAVIVESTVEVLHFSLLHDQAHE
ncbi:unnamed protein product, partial [Didymodactylos carnosus]